MKKYEDWDKPISVSSDAHAALMRLINLREKSADTVTVARTHIHTYSSLSWQHCHAIHDESHANLSDPPPDSPSSLLSPLFHCLACKCSSFYIQRIVICAVLYIYTQYITMCHQIQAHLYQFINSHGSHSSTWLQYLNAGLILSSDCKKYYYY